MILYRITLAPLSEKLRAEDSGLLSPFYADDATFDGSALQSAQILKMLMQMESDRGYFPEPDDYLFILYTPGQEAASKREFTAEGLVLNFVSGIR